MTAGVFVALARESFHDALRDRVGLGVLALAVLLALGVDRCTGFGAGIQLNGRTIDPHLLARVIGPISFVTTGLVLVASAGLLACDALARPLGDGSAWSVLCRPIGRLPWALARLAGSLALAASAGVAVLLGATLLLASRHELSAVPGLVGSAVFVADALAVASLALAMSLVLPRLLAFFAVLLWVQIVVVTNVAHMMGALFGGWLGALERFGPPIGTALLFAVAPWVGVRPATPELLACALRLLAWTAAGLLATAFLLRRVEPR